MDGLELVANHLRLSHAEVVARAAVRAAWLQAMRQDGPFHVAFMLDNVSEFIFWLEAAALAGAVVVGANPTHRGNELVRDLAHTECQPSSRTRDTCHWWRALASGDPLHLGDLRRA